jgi:addiction module HigA family antidote
MTTKKRNAQEILEEIVGRPLTLNGLLESLRLCDEMSQVAFAKQLEISPSHLCDIEKGRKPVSPERAVRFAKILGHSPEQFLRLALQFQVDQAKLKYKVRLEAV